MISGTTAAPDVTVGEATATATSRLRDAGSPTPRLDAEVLLGHLIGRDRAWLLAHPEALVADAGSFAVLIERRAAGEPVAYLRGFKEWHWPAVPHRPPRPHPASGDRAPGRCGRRGDRVAADVGAGRRMGRRHRHGRGRDRLGAPAGRCARVRTPAPRCQRHLPGCARPGRGEPSRARGGGSHPAARGRPVGRPRRAAPPRRGHRQPAVRRERRGRRATRLARVRAAHRARRWDRRPRLAARPARRAGDARGAGCHAPSWRSGWDRQSAIEQLAPLGASVKVVPDLAGLDRVVRLDMPRLDR